MDLQARSDVSTPAGTIAVRTAGEGPTVLLVHGIPGSAGVWTEVAQGLLESGFQVLVPDLLGFGDSDRPAGLAELWVDTQATALAHVLQAMDTTPAVVVGHDYGAPIGVTLAHRHPRLVSALVLAAGNLFTDTPIPVPLNVVTWPAIGPPASRAMFSTPMLHMILRTGVGRPRMRLDPAVHLGDPEQRQAIRTIFAAALRELGERYSDVEAALPSLEHPTTVLWGDRDPFFDVHHAERTAAAIPNATLRIVSNAGHFLPTERPTDFVEAVRQLARYAHGPTP